MRSKGKGTKKEKAKGVAVVPDVVREEEIWDDHVEHILNELQRLYGERIEPPETAYEYNTFKPSWFRETLKQKKPFVTFLGPFSSGKSTFINYLMQSEYLLTGPQPLTDKFNIIMYGDRPQSIPGRVLLADSNQPFRGLTQFGDAFAEFLTGFMAPHPILKSLTFVDTPGVLEAAGDIHGRRYDYVQVVRWFVEKSDIVFFLFDPTKLDAGAELRAVFQKALKGFESKIRIVLNKADTVKPQELLRVYGALFWNLSNLVDTTEPPRVYVSSFWDKDYRPGTNHELFAAEKEDLLYELIETVPLQSLDYRVTTVMRRAVSVMVWSVLCATYRTRIPAVFGKDKAKAAFFAQYDDIVKDLASKYTLSINDFPPRAEVKAYLARVPSHKYPDMEKLMKKGWITRLRQAVDTDFPALLGPIKQHAIVDPRDRKRAIASLRAYTKQKAEEENTVAVPAPHATQAATMSASAPAAVTSLPPQDMQMQMQMQQQQQQMFAMMQMMLMQQQQQQAGASPAALSSQLALAQSQPPLSIGWPAQPGGGEVQQSSQARFAGLSPEQQEQLMSLWMQQQQQQVAQAKQL